MKMILHLAFAVLTCASAYAAEMETAAARARRIEMPRVQLEDATLLEACEFFSKQSRALEPNRKSVNIVVAAEGQGRIAVNLERKPLLVALREAVAQVGCEVQEEPYALVIREKGAPKLPTIVEAKEVKEGAYRKKLDGIIVPVVEMHETTVREAIDFLIQKSKQLDPNAPGGGGVAVMAMFGGQGSGIPVPAAPPAVQGIPGLPASAAKVAPAPPVGPAERRITLRCDEMPLLEVYRYVTALAGLEMELDKHYRVNIHPPKAKPKAR